MNGGVIPLEALMQGERFWRDAIGRLTIDEAGIDSKEYPRVCRALAEAFALIPHGDFAIGLDQIFWDFQRGDQVIGMDWDIWMQFMVVAKTPSAESLVREIGSWLDLNRSDHVRSNAG